MPSLSRLTTRWIFVLLLWSGHVVNVASLSIKSTILSSTLNKINGDTSGVTTPPSTAESTNAPEFAKDPSGADILVMSAQELQEEESLISVWPGAAGATALRQVQFLASSASENTDAMDESQFSLATRRQNRMQMYTPKQEKRKPTDGASVVSTTKNLWRRRRERKERQRLNKLKNSVDPMGEGAGVFNNAEFSPLGKKEGVTKLKRSDLEVSSSDKREEQVWTALANLELDMQLLDNLAGQKPQLTGLELLMLSTSVAAAASGPWILGGKLTEFLAPTAAAFSAALGIGAEYVGRVAVADGKEVAAASIGCASEAEGFLAQAERAKAITPLCVGVGATATTFSLLVPVLLGSIQEVSVMTEIYIACPLISVLSAAVCSLALQDTKVFAKRATSVGNRRFAKSGLVGRTWLSAGEQITGKSNNYRSKWRTFCLSVLPAPILGALVPGASLATKSIIVAALAAAQSAYFLADCEYCLARATDAVAIKARSAAVCDTYANQGARSAAILPFTSALSGLCAAATAAIVELPYLETLSAAGTVTSLFGEMFAVAIFPAFSTLFAAAASVSKARCEVQAEAAVQAASTLALEYDTEEDEDPILRPFRGVAELIRLTYTSSILEPCQQVWRRFRVSLVHSWSRIRSLIRRGDDFTGKRNKDAPALAYMDTD